MRTPKVALALLLCMGLGMPIVGCTPHSSDSSLNASQESASSALADAAKPEPVTCSAQLDETSQTFSLGTTIDALKQQGFELGDGVDVTFDNGVKFSNIPFLSLGATRPNVAFLHAKDEDAAMTLSCEGTNDEWQKILAQPSASCTISLCNRAFYIDQQNASVSYTSKRSDYDSDEAYANEREVSTGKILPGRLYRSCSPCDNVANRAYYANKLAEENGITFSLDLSDERVSRVCEMAAENESAYYYDLAAGGNVLTLGIDFAFVDKTVVTKIADGLRAMSQHDGPYLVHCIEGKDRTGFVCMLLGALCGADYYEIADDYMKTYQSYSGLTKTTDPTKYDAIVTMRCKRVLLTLVKNDISSMLATGYGLDLRYNGPDEDMSAVRDAPTPTAKQLQRAARNYLKVGGMTDAELDALVAKLCN